MKGAFKVQSIGLTSVPGSFVPGQVEPSLPREAFTINMSLIVEDGSSFADGGVGTNFQFLVTDPSEIQVGALYDFTMIKRKTDAK